MKKARAGVLEMKTLRKSPLLLVLLTMFLTVGVAGCTNDPLPTLEDTPEVMATPTPEDMPEVMVMPEPEETPEVMVSSEPEETLEVIVTPELEETQESENMTTTSVSGEIISDLTDISNYWMEVDGVRYQIGAPFSTLEDGFEVVQIDQSFINETMEPRYLALIAFQKRNEDTGRTATISTRIANITDEDILIRDGIVMSISLMASDADALNDPVFINGIQISSTTRAEVEAMFGEADEVIESSVSVSLRYAPFGMAARVHYRFTFSLETEILSSISMEFLDVDW